MSGLELLEKASPKKLKYIDWCASAGHKLENQSAVRQSPDDLARELGVTRQTLYNWRSKAGFWDMVRARRDSIVSEDMASNIYIAMYKAALSGNVQAAKLLLNQADILKADKGNTDTGQVDNSITIINYAATLPDDVKRKVIEAESSGTPTPQGE